MSDIEEEGTVPATENQSGIVSHRTAKMVVIFMSAMIVIALGLVVLGIARKMGGPDTSTAISAAAPNPAIFTLPPGATIKDMQVQNDRVILRVQSSQGEEIDIVDTQTGRLVAKIRSAPQNP